jgi:hypothetical protein
MATLPTTQPSLASRANNDSVKLPYCLEMICADVLTGASLDHEDPSSVHTLTLPRMF